MLLSPLPSELRLKIIQKLDVASFPKFYRSSRAAKNYCEMLSNLIEIYSHKESRTIKININEAEVICVFLYQDQVISKYSATTLLGIINATGMYFFNISTLSIESTHSKKILKLPKLANGAKISCKRVTSSCILNLKEIFNLFQTNIISLEVLSPSMEEFPSYFVNLTHFNCYKMLPRQVVTFFSTVGRKVKNTELRIDEILSQKDHQLLVNSLFDLAKNVADNFYRLYVAFICPDQEVLDEKLMSQNRLESIFGGKLALIPKDNNKYLLVIRTDFKREIIYEIKLVESWHSFLHPIYFSIGYNLRRKELSLPFPMEEIKEKYKKFFV